MFYLNLYYTVIKDEKGYSFVELNMSEKKNSYLTFNEEQEMVFNQLIEGKGIEREPFQQIFGEEVFNSWFKKQILVSNPIDQKSIYSRSKAFYWRNQCGNVQDILKKKKVLVLGCGGIGSHVGWNLTTMGIGEISFVDFDVIELSNLNRQLLYEEKDVGKHKVEVLKEKLQNVNSDVVINAICQKISSESDLEKICTDKPYDLIIKSVDSPLAISKWLDSVCKKNKLRYISAIVMDSYLAAGPTYIPGKTLLYSEILETQENRERVAGVAPSLGFMMYEIAGRVSEEAFKILINKGKLRYTNKIECRDCMSDIVFSFVGKNKKEVRDNMVLTDMILFLFAFYLESCFPQIRLAVNIVLILYAVVVPLLVTTEKAKMHKLGVVNLLVFQISNIIYMLPQLNSMRTWNFYEILVLITSLFLAVSIMLIVTVLAQDVMWKIREKIHGGVLAHD